MFHFKDKYLKMKSKNLLLINFIILISLILAEIKSIGYPLQDTISSPEEHYNVGQQHENGENLDKYSSHAEKVKDKELEEEAIHLKDMGHQKDFNEEIKQADIHSNFKDFKHKFGKKYQHEKEENLRFEIFKKNWEKSEEMNDFTRKHDPHNNLEFGINKFFDMDDDEFKKYYLTLRPETLIELPNLKVFKNEFIKDDTVSVLSKYTSSPQERFHDIDFRQNKNNFEIANTNLISQENINSDKYLNYVDLKFVSQVKDQLKCGSCYAHATTSAIESLYLIKKKIEVSLSEQELISCDNTPVVGNFGCDGGYLTNSFDYCKKNGIGTEKNNPYQAKVSSCSKNFLEENYPISGYYNWNLSDKENTMKDALKQYGPAAITLDATPFKYYKKGIIDSTVKCTTTINHAVLLVGYGIDSVTGMKYWIIKNSWGKNWGEDGFVRIQRGINLCGIATQMLTPHLNEEEF